MAHMCNSILTWAQGLAHASTLFFSLYICPKVHVRSSSSLASSRAPGSSRAPPALPSTNPLQIQQNGSLQPLLGLSKKQAPVDKSEQMAFENTAPVDKSEKTARLCSRSKKPHLPTNQTKRFSGATSGPSKTLHLSTNRRKWLSKTVHLPTNTRKQRLSGVTGR